MCSISVCFGQENVQQLKIKLNMAEEDDENLFDVLNLGTDYDCQLPTDSFQNQMPQDFGCYMDMRNDIKEQIEDLACTAESQDTQIHQENQQEEYSEKQYQKAEYSTTTLFGQTINGEIQFSQEKKKLRDLVFQGYNYETQNMGKHLKSTTSSYLTLLSKTKSLEPEEEEAVQVFFNTNGAIEDFKTLFEVESLGLKCREYFQSDTFMRSFLGSGRMDIRSKLVMIRHLQKYRQLTFKEASKWRID